MPTKHKEEWTVLCRGLFLSTHGKGNIIKKVVPIILVLIDKLGKSHFQGLIGAFIKAITLGMVCSCHRPLDVKPPAKLCVDLKIHAKYFTSYDKHNGQENVVMR